MNFAPVEQIARAVLYEGYLLYPYRAAALKNRQRWMFGRLLPRDYSLHHAGSEPWSMQTECLVVGDQGTALTLKVRFLQLAEEHTTPEAVEREVDVAASLSEIVTDPRRIVFSFGRGMEGSAVAPDPQVVVPLTGAVTIAAVEAGERLFKLTVVVENLTPCVGSLQRDLDQALLLSLISTHMILHVAEGEFVSLIDPPEWCAAGAGTCRNIGTWPVLAGPEAGRLMLSSPIILPDEPQIAPESPGDLCDGTEIDEILTLRIQTLTDEEKRQMRLGGGEARRILERTEALSEEQLRKLHGRFQETQQRPRASFQAPSFNGREPANRPGVEFQTGEHVRLQPRGGADAFDLLLAGQRATIVSIERDFEDRVHLGVVLDDDPGKDFGAQGLPGHRFFFSPEEVERLS
jgi:hypothetical protein